MRKGIVMAFAKLIPTRQQQDSGPAAPNASTAGAATPRKQPLRLRAGFMTITPEVASRILNELNFEDQRDADTAGARQHIHNLAIEMRHGLWIEGVQIHFACFEDRLYLVDGQHRLLAMIEAEMDITFHVLITTVSSYKEVRQLYYRHDTVCRPRTNSQVVSAAGIDVAHDMSTRQANRVLAAVKLIVAGFTYVNTNRKALELRVPDRLFAAGDQWWAPAKQFFGAISTADAVMRGRLTRQATMAVGLVTFRYEAEKALEFWGDVARDDGLHKGDPRKTLSRDLLDTRFARKESVGYASRAATMAWNAFFEGHQLGSIRVQMESPVVIAGTPVGRRAQK